MMSSKVYLKTGFWSGLSSIPSIDGIRARVDVYDALKGSYVITDATEDMLLCDEFLKIIKQNPYERCSEQYIDNVISNLKPAENAEDLCATYLTDKSTNECKNIENHYGVLMLNAETAIQKRYLFKGDGFSLDKNRLYIKGYIEFKEHLSHPCNSLIVIDPYLLSKREKKDNVVNYPGIANNLESLLDAILPMKLEVDFHLTIISNVQVESDILKEVRRVSEKIKKCLKRIRKELSIRLCVVYAGGKGYRYNVESFHSRHILSNTFAIDSEDGFDLFNEKGYVTKNNPSISIVFPRLLYGDNRKDKTKYYNWITSVKKYIEESPDYFIYGNKDNRLFDLIGKK